LRGKTAAKPQPAIPRGKLAVGGDDAWQEF
jgi:hypothetical protein